jgi:gliding motility-associated-like protein
MKSHKRILLLLLLLCNGFGFYAYGQAPVITPKTKPVLPLDGSGHYTVNWPDVADIPKPNDSPLVVRAVPLGFDCSTLGDQTVKLKALTNGSPRGPLPTSAVGFPGRPIGVAYDSFGNLYVVSNVDFSIRKITPAGVVTIFAGNGTRGYENGPGVTARFGELYGIAIDADNNVYVSDSFHDRIRKITPAGEVSTYSGNGIHGGTDGNFNLASFASPEGLAFDAAGNLFVADFDSHKIRKITPDRIVSTVTLTIDPPRNITTDAAGNVYWTEFDALGEGHHKYIVQKATPDGVVSVFAGSGTRGFLDGPQMEAQFGYLVGIVFDAVGNMYVADGTAIRKITTNGNVITLAGSSAFGYFDAKGDQARIKSAWGIALDQCNNIIFADYDNQAIRKVTQGGDVTTVAGGGFVLTGKIPPSTCQFSTADIPVYIQSKPTITSALPPVVVSGCATLADYTIHVTATDNCPTPTITYSQSPTAGTPFTNNNPVTVTITATDSYGGTDVKSFTVTNTSVGANAPRVSVVPQSTQICEGDPARFHAEVTGADAGTAYQWLVNGINTGTNSPDFITSDLKSNDVVNCVVTTGGGCGVPVSGPVVPLVISPKPVITLKPTEQILAGNSITLNPVVPGNIVSYKWLPETGLSDAGSRYPVASPETTTTYTLTVTSDQNCEAQASVKITVVNQIAIPNTFTPNGDGTNDLWTIKYLDSYANCTVSVYSRNGGQVFQSKGYGVAWNGNSAGKPLPVGVYYYIIDLKDGSPPLSGNVTILR